jgi:GNAT superfamily N-acetyltransferase
MNESPNIQVVPLRPENAAQSAYCCMTEVPTPWPQALCQCREWISQHIGVHVDGFHLQMESGQIIGHLYYASSEQALFSYQVEPGVGVLYCEWVQQRYQKKGLGTLLFETFIHSQEEKHAKGILVETTDIEGQMHYSHYQSRGFETIAASGHNQLMYLPLAAQTIQFQSRPVKVSPRRRIPVEIYLFRGFLCPYEVSTLQLVREVAQEFGDRVVLKEIWLTPETLATYGVASGVLINGRRKLAGGESERAVRQAIMEEL